LDNATPLINQLVAELNSAHAQLSTLPPGSFKLVKRQDLLAIGSILTPLISVGTFSLSKLWSIAMIIFAVYHPRY
jgi:hypothetical protein